MSVRRPIAVGVPIVVGVGLVAVLVSQRTGGIGPVRWRVLPQEAYPSAQTCATCHPRQVVEWEASSHSRAQDDPLIHAAVCGRCHTPVGTMLDADYMFKVRDGQALAEMPPAAAEGITCVVCHATDHTPTQQVLTLIPVWPNWQSTDLAVTVPAFTAAIGPYGSGSAGDPAPVPNDSHDSHVDPAISRSEFCRPCHDVVLDKGPLARQTGGPQLKVHLLATYDEWAASDYPSQGKTCQSCHMTRATVPEPGAVEPQGVRFAETLPPRFWSDHTFAGVDTAYWLRGAEVERQVQNAASRLAGAAAIDLGTPPQVAPGTAFDLSVRMRNIGAGHDLPTGFAFWREVWLDVTVADATGRVLFSSGRTDDDGWLSDEYNPRVREDPSLYDPYLVSLRARMVRSPANAEKWRRADGTVAVPAAAIKLNRNGTPILSWSEYNADPIVSSVLGPSAVGPGRSSPLEEVYVLREAEAIIPMGIPALHSREATFPVTVDAAAKAPLRVTARLLMRAMSLSMTSQQVEISAAPPVRPVYEIARAQASVPLAGE